MEYFTGYIDQIIFQNEDTGYIVANFVCEDRSFFVRGIFPGATPYLEYSVGGVWSVHPKYGEQFEIQVVEFVQPTSREQIFSFLSSGVISGVGEATAKLMVEQFGERTLEVIEQSPNELLKLPGIGPKKLSKICESYMETMNIRNNLMFFYSLGVGTNAAVKIMESLGANAVALITENPYILMDKVRGYAFKKADMIAAKLGVRKDSEYRVRACIIHCLKNALADGHTYSYVNDVASVCEKHDIARELSVATMITLSSEGVLLIYGENRVALLYVDEMESEIAEKLAKLSVYSNPLYHDPNYVRDFEKRAGIGFDIRQVDAINGVYQEGVYVITGGPGTGKTTIINAIIGAFEKQAKEVVLCAPTGRAAKKLSDATHRTAKTIHRTLGSNGERFTKCAEDPLKCDVVIVDESSMVDIFLMNSLLKAISPGTSLILVGDKDQLPSVGAGSVFRDILLSGKIKVITLTHIFRQSEKSMISMNAGRIIRGEMPQNGEDFFIFGGGDDLNERVVELVTRKIPERFGFCPTTEIQVLSVRYDGEAGVHALNQSLKAVLNPGNSEGGMRNSRGFAMGAAAGTGGGETQISGGKAFAPGDKVMQISNNYDIEWEDQDEQLGKGVFNGDIGTIKKFDSASGLTYVEFEDGRIAVYDKVDLTELTHAYAITVHKSQGSEYPCIVMPIFSSYTMENRNILYTAVTRAKKLVVLLGEISVLRRFVERISIDDRRSTLSEKLITVLDYKYRVRSVSE